MGTGVSYICIMDDYQTIGCLFQEIYVNINNGSKHSAFLISDYIAFKPIKNGILRTDVVLWKMTKKVN